MITGPVEPTRRLFEDDAYRDTAEAEVVEVSGDSLILDRTIFYAESGGQPGDRGVMEGPAGQRLTVLDTRYLPGKVRIQHQVEGAAGLLGGDRVGLSLDWSRRLQHMRMHTCLHVLCGLVCAPVTGCSVNAGRSRIDFDLEESRLSREELDERLQAVIAADLEVTAHWYDGSELAEAGAEAWSVKPPATGGGRMRVIRVDGVDAQPCGGTHVASTGELAGLQVSKIQKKSRHNRRVTVVDHQE